MKNLVSDKQKTERTHKMLELSDKLEKEYYQKYINKEVILLTEEYKDGYTYGYTDNYLRIIEIVYKILCTYRLDR